MVVGINSDAMLANKWKCLINNNKMTPGSLFFFLVVFCFWRKPVWPNENWSSIFLAIFWNSISKSQPVTLVQLTLVHVGDVVLKIPHLPIRFTLFEMSWTLTYYACQLLIWLQKKVWNKLGENSINIAGDNQQDDTDILVFKYAFF